MKDPEGVLEKQGRNTQHNDMFRFTDVAQVSEKETVIRSYLEEAMAYAEAGIKPPKNETTLDLPDELVDALDADPELAEAFHKLTPGRKKSYAINLSSAKKAETRIARIEKLRPKILAGKGAMER
ncbi:MAG: YdeI/OmpD-associated family protein [Pseudomonadota bacterium]